MKAKQAAYTIVSLLFAWAPRVTFAQPKCEDADGNPVVCNPIAANNIQDFLETTVNAITQLAVPVIVIAIIYVGFQFVTAGGDKEQIEDAKKAALYVVIGSAVILGANLLTTILQETASGLGA